MCQWLRLRPRDTLVSDGRTGPVISRFAHVNHGKQELTSGRETLDKELGQVQSAHNRQFGRILDQFRMEEHMSSAASLITVLASVAFGLIVIAVVVRVFGDRTT